MSRPKSTNPKRIRQCVECGETHHTNRLRCCACYYRHRYGIAECPGCGKEIVARWAMCRECNGKVVRNRKWTTDNSHEPQDRGHATPCWIWKGAIIQAGYGYVALPRGPVIPAHRWMYMQIRGDIPDGLHLDHLCRQPACVNPDHLEPVTPAENVRRSLLFRAKRKDA